MRRIETLWASAALAFLSMASGAWAEDSYRTQSGERATVGEAHGIVESVDSTHHSLTLSNGQRLIVDPGAQVTKDGKVTALKDIRQGDDVRASFAPGSSTATEVNALTPARQIMDGVPLSSQQELLHETWTRGG